MKHYLIAGVALLVLSSCEKDPDLDALDTDYVVYTEFLDGVDFSRFQTYYLPDSILEPGQGRDATYWKDDYAQMLISEVSLLMDGRGFTRLAGEEGKETADLGLQMTYIAQTNQVTTGGLYYGWWDYGYWGPWWSSWYYPYAVTYSYDTGTLLLELVDLTKASDDGTARRLPVVWYANAQGYSFGNSRADAALLLKAIDQAFAQSPYVKHGN